MTWGARASAAFLPVKLVVGALGLGGLVLAAVAGIAALLSHLPSGPAALPQSLHLQQAAPPEALSAPPLATCHALDLVSEAACLNRCLRAEIDFVFYHSSNGVLCMVPCALAVGGAELKGY